ncbi:MAG TPA: GNAT family N-acetyltransferase [Kamptonema sp.]|nr:GNAT family N-acetyltransferase [Kamptonema sp.]
MYSINKINLFTAANYVGMTYPAYRNYLKLLNGKTPFVAIGANNNNDQPVGLVLAEILPNEHNAEVLSIFVDSKHRCQGIGTAMLAQLEQELVKEGCTTANLSYTTDKTTTPAIERLLIKSNWSSPQSRMFICKATPKQMLSADWMHRCSLPDSFATFFWRDLTEGERREILRKQQAEPWYPDILSPFSEEKIIEPLNSLGLRYQGEVVGWMITHRLAPDTIRYSRLFVKKELQKMGRAISLLAQAIKYHYDSGIPYGIWTVQQDNTPMVSFMQRRMLSYMNEIVETKGSSKVLV